MQTNQEIYNKFISAYNVTVIKVRTMEWSTALQARRSRVRFQMVQTFRQQYGPGVDSAINRNEYKENFLRGKGGRCARLIKLPPACAVRL